MLYSGSFSPAFFEQVAKGLTKIMLISYHSAEVATLNNMVNASWCSINYNI